MLQYLNWNLPISFVTEEPVCSASKHGSERTRTSGGPSSCRSDLTLFFIIEHFIKDNYWATQTSIDYHIPFIPQFIVIYDSWSFLLFALGIYLIVKDPEGFRRYMWTILLTFFTATAFCALVPNGQDLRPAVMEQHNFFTWMVQ